MKPDGSELAKAFVPPAVKPDPAGAPVRKGPGEINANLSTRQSQFAADGDWLYYAGSSGIYRMEPDGSNPTRIFYHHVNRLNLVGDWIYFIDYKSSSNIARIRTDGSDHGLIYDGAVDEMVVLDDWIYFSDGVNNQICKIKTDGTDFRVLCQGRGIILNLEGEWLYWRGYLDDQAGPEGIYKIKLAGSEPVKVYGDYTTYMTVEKDHIYFQAEGDLMLMDHNGTQARSVLALESEDFLKGVYRGWTYYQDRDLGNVLVRVNLSSGERQKVLDAGGFLDIYFLDEQIIYLPRENGEPGIMDLDGSDDRKFKSLPD